MFPTLIILKLPGLQNWYGGGWGARYVILTTSRVHIGAYYWLIIFYTSRVPDSEIIKHKIPECESKNFLLVYTQLRIYCYIRYTIYQIIITYNVPCIVNVILLWLFQVHVAPYS